MPLWAKIYQADSQRMPEIEDESVALVVTSPPYWHLKDYGVPAQLGYGQDLHDYLRGLYRVWREAYRVLLPGRRLCVNIGDQFARAVIYGRYKVIPLHAEVIAQAEQIGFDYMGAIIWQKRTTMNTTGGATVMGSFPYPPNGIVEIDYEYILIFKKPGKTVKVPREVKEASRLSKEEWKAFFSGHWVFGGARQIAHEAVFPAELPRRLIKMFSFKGETVLDPFAGSGTTLEQALALGRNAIGYEINPRFVTLARDRLQKFASPMFGVDLVIDQLEEGQISIVEATLEYTPRIRNAAPQVPPDKMRFGAEAYYRVRDLEEDTLVLDTGLRVALLGIEVVDEEAYRAYVQRYLVGRQVFLRYDAPERTGRNGRVRAYVYLKNKIFVNAYLLKAGIARPTADEAHRLSEKFRRLWREGAKRRGERVDFESGDEPLGIEQET